MAAVPLPRQAGFAFAEDDGDLTKAVHRCVGVGKCRADSSGSGGFMCPSYLATRDEKDSTRGRARVLQEMAHGHPGLRRLEITRGTGLPGPVPVLQGLLGGLPGRAWTWPGTSPRWLTGPTGGGCGRARTTRWASCPAGPRLGWGRAPAGQHAAADRAAGHGGARRGRDGHPAAIPPFAPVPFRRSAGRRSAPAGAPDRAPRRPVVLWADSFSDAFDPEVPQAAVTVLEEAGYQVIVPDRAACCGLTWISTGQLDGARRRLGTLLDVLGPYAEAGIPIVGLEPSCTAVLRSDLGDLFPGDARAAAVAAATRTLAELLTAPPPLGPGPQWAPPDLAGRQIIAQPHCHHYSVMGYGPDRALLAAAGATVTTLAGCCGLAGNFGMEKGHYEVSAAVAELALLPALRGAAPGTVFLADGFSCRTQADQLGSVRGQHLAQILASPAWPPTASPVTRAGAATTLRSRLRGGRRGPLLGDGVAAVDDQALPGDVGRAGCGEPGDSGGNLAG